MDTQFREPSADEELGEFKDLQAASVVGSSAPSHGTFSDNAEKYDDLFGETLLAKAANQLVSEGAEKREAAFGDEGLFHAKRAPEEMDMLSSDNNIFQSNTSLQGVVVTPPSSNLTNENSGAGEMHFDDVFGAPISESLVSPPSVSPRQDDDNRIRMRKHTSFEEEERFDLDAVLASASMETVKRTDAFVEALHEGAPPEDVDRILEQERANAVESTSPQGASQSVSGSKGTFVPIVESDEPMVVATPIDGPTKVVPVRSESDNASVFDLEAVLTAPPDSDSFPAGSVNSSDYPISATLTPPAQEIGDDVTKMQSTPRPTLKRSEPSEFDLERALAVDLRDLKEHPSGQSIQSEGTLNTVSENENEESPARPSRGLFLRQSSSLFSDGQFPQEQAQDEVPVLSGVVVLNEREVIANAGFKPSDSNEPTPPTTRWNSMAEGAYGDGLDEIEIAMAAVRATELQMRETEHESDQRLFDDIAPVVSSIPKANLTQTDHLNRVLLTSTLTSNIPSQFFEAANALEESDGEYSDESSVKDDDQNMGRGMREYLARVRAGEEELENEYDRQESQSSSDVGAIKLQRQFTSTSSEFETAQGELQAALPDNSGQIFAASGGTTESAVTDDFGDFEDAQASPASVPNPGPPSSAPEKNATELDDDFGDFEEADFQGTAPSVPAPASSSITEPAPVQKSASAVGIREPEPSFFAPDDDKSVKDILGDLTRCSKCGAPLHADLFSACIACGDNSAQSGSMRSLNIARTSSAQAPPQSERIKNDLMVAIEFDKCEEDPSALPIAALAASDNDESALKLLLGEDVRDTRRTSHAGTQHVTSVTSAGGVNSSQQQAAVPSSANPPSDQHRSSMPRPASEKDDTNSFYVV